MAARFLFDGHVTAGCGEALRLTCLYHELLFSRQRGKEKTEPIRQSRRLGNVPELHDDQEIQSTVAGAAFRGQTPGANRFRR